MWGKGPLARGCDDRLTPSRMCQECVRTAGSSVQAGRERIWTATGERVWAMMRTLPPWALDRGAVIGATGLTTPAAQRISRLRLRPQQARCSRALVRLAVRSSCKKLPLDHQRTMNCRRGAVSRRETARKWIKTVWSSPPKIEDDSESLA